MKSRLCSLLALLIILALPVQSMWATPIATTTTVVRYQALVEQGSILNQQAHYDQAIHLLSKAIKLNPLQGDAYLERSFSYLATKRLTLAQKDYQKSKKLGVIRPRSHRSSHLLSKALGWKEIYDFSTGFSAGLANGVGESVCDIIPTIKSIWNIFYNSTLGLFFSSSTQDADANIFAMISAVMEMIKSGDLSLDMFAPEVGELSKEWSQLTPRIRGEKSGFIVGKYGADIFIPGQSVKAVKKWRALKQAGKLTVAEQRLAQAAAQAEARLGTATVQAEARAATIATESTITAEGAVVVGAMTAEEAVLFARAQKIIQETANAGEFVAQTPNHVLHVMQKKHAWDKIIPLTGNAEHDFKQVTSLLKEIKFIENSKLDYKFIAEKANYVKINYVGTINSLEIEVQLMTNLETKSTCIVNAFVKVVDK